VVIDAEGTQVSSLSIDAAGVPTIATFGPMIDGNLFALSLGAEDIPIWSIIHVAP
jgi:hypothetical protein